MSGNITEKLPQEVPILRVTTERISILDARTVVTCRPSYSGEAHHSRENENDHGKRTTDIKDSDLDFVERNVEDCDPMSHSDTGTLRLRGGGPPSRASKSDDEVVLETSSISGSAPQRRKALAGAKRGNPYLREDPEPEPKINSARRGRKTGGVGTSAPRLKLKVLSANGGKKAAGAYVGLSAALDKLRNTVGSDSEGADEEAMPGDQWSERRVSPSPSSSPNEDPIEVARRAAQTVLTETAKSRNLQGGIRGSINKACKKIVAALELLQSQNESEEIRTLKADNKRMREELAQMRSETKALRRAYSERGNLLTADSVREEITAVCNSLKEHLSRELFISLGGMINTRLEEVRSRLPPEPILRPPLAADRQNTAALTESPQAGTRGGPTKMKASQTGSTLMPPARPAQAPTANKSAAAGSKKTKTKKKAPNQTQTYTHTQEEWVAVEKRGAKKKQKKKTSATPKAQTAKPTATTVPPKKLIVPKTAAVVVALKPDTTESYASVMLRATKAFRLEEVGLENVRIKRTADGARILEVNGADNGRSADELKTRLEAAIGDAAKVYRPVKLARLRVSDLDEAATPEAVAGAIAAKGGCSVADVKVGDIRIGFNGTGSTLAQCPIEAASAAATARRVTIGWSVARIVALEPEALRCYKCLSVGHTRATCPSSIDRGNLCFRCSKPGHKGADCQAEAFCAVCHLAKLPARHRMGGLSCHPPKVKGVEARTGNRGAPDRAPSGAAQIQEPPEERPMDL
ncbi:uncharacterized protein LOC125229103 [Leguminivora glycinivorella]|uniref:uncharacterized protein LOC125229103 n=1 Tax=Leguminivora glycinivorella TaxID=1035111 RepID=UPI002010AB81|nr:uncharacterized protein LOC125229103 [Leguminivora glycinivorella]